MRSRGPIRFRSIATARSQSARVELSGDRDRDDLGAAEEVLDEGQQRRNAVLLFEQGGVLEQVARFQQGRRAGPIILEQSEHGVEIAPRRGERAAGFG